MCKSKLDVNYKVIFSYKSDSTKRKITMKIKKTLIWILITLLLTVVILTVLFLAKKYYSNVYPSVFISNKSGDWGAFGDFFGGILNPIFGLISVSLILVTIWQQKSALAQTTKQINLSVEEMTKSVAAQEKQAELSEKQLKELMKKSELDESIRVLNNLINDLNDSIDEALVCFHNKSVMRSLKSQLMDLNNRNNTEQKKDFFRLHNYSYRHFLETYEYAESVLSDLKAIDKGITYNYYKQKVNVFKNLLLIEE